MPQNRHFLWGMIATRGGISVQIADAKRVSWDKEGRKSGVANHGRMATMDHATRISIGELRTVLYRHDGCCYLFQSHRLSTYAAEPSRSHPSIWAGSFNCWPRSLGTATYEQSSPGRIVMSPQSFSNCSVG